MTSVAKKKKRGFACNTVIFTLSLNFYSYSYETAIFLSIKWALKLSGQFRGRERDGFFKRDRATERKGCINIRTRERNIWRARKTAREKKSR